MALPSSGQISMQDINTEYGVASTTANSSTENRTFNFAAAGVDQNRGYAFSEFYSETYVALSNSDTIHAAYWYDGGQSPNNAVLDGWCSSADAAAQTVYVGGGPFTHTIYYNGTIGNGTVLYLNGSSAPAAGYGAHVVDSNTGLNGGGGCSSPYYYLASADATFRSSTDGIYYYSPSITITDWNPIGGTFTWSLTVGSLGATLIIDRNYSNVVTQTTNNSGNFTDYNSDYIQASLTADASYPLNAESNMDTYQDGSYYNYNSVGYLSATTNANWTISSKGSSNSITGNTYEY